MRVCFAANNNIYNCCLIKQVLSGSEREAKHALTLFPFSWRFHCKCKRSWKKEKCIPFNLSMSTSIVFNEF